MKPSNNYHGARFYKCDLHMHTPADRSHWIGDPLPLNPAEKDYKGFAGAYIRQCYEAGLEVIAVTDHNFASKEFMRYVLEAIQTLKHEYSYEIIVFPGFEVAGPIGKGAHLVCIFEPEASLDAVDGRLTQLDLPVDARWDENKKPRPIPTANMTFERMLEIVQRDAAFRGICIGVHPNDRGVMDRDTVEQWWSQEVIRNNEFLCMELPRPRAEYIERPGNSLIKSILLNRDGRYHRLQPIATVCSSDCDKLSPREDGEKNYIGFRSTWIKMSEPSIESLRQAFLDHESRIRYGPRPEESYTYSKINNIQVRGASFLADESIAFSPNLNTLIGGRGTGKSTIIEYLRLGLDQERMIRGEEPRRNLERLKKTVRSNTSIKISVEKQDQTWVIERVGDSTPQVVAGTDLPDIARFFPVRILSQKEIYAIAEDRDARGRLVDDLIRLQLDEISRRAQDLTRKIRELNEQILAHPELTKRKRDLETEKLEFKTRLEKLRALEKPLSQWKGLLAEDRFFKQLDDERKTIVRSIKELIEDLEFSCTAIGSELSESLNADLISGVANKADTLLRALKDSVLRSVETFDSSISSIFERDEVKEWCKTFENAQLEYESLREELKVQGTDPDQYLEYQRQLREREVQITEVQKRLDGLSELRLKRDGKEGKPGKLCELRELWKEETQARKEMANQLTNAVPKTKKGEPFVKVSVEAFGDDRSFAIKMRELVQDRRRVGQDDWGSFDEVKRNIVPDASFLAKIVEARKPEQSPIEVFISWVKMLRSGKQPEGCPWGPDDRRTKVLLEWCNDKRLMDLELWRAPDRVRVELYRQDGSRVGELEEGLSVGQRCTAVLALLLAHDEVPAIIDQPEEDLDNEFVYRELVPLLREIKERRQLLIATHNANIPVNADAELILALEVQSEHGKIKRIEGQPCIGALDRNGVRLAVEEIMEGSEEAFRKRYKKYGF